MRNPPATILCVDDEETALRVRKLVLESHGYRVFAVATADNALEIFKNNEIDLVITDHLLPKILGTELAKQMKQLKPRVPIALLTGLPEPPDGIEHADCHLVKGDDLSKVLQRVSQLLDSPHGARGTGSNKKSDRIARSR